MQGNIRFMSSLEIAIVARSFRSIVKIQSNLTTDPTRSQIINKSSPYRNTVARGNGFRLGYSFRANAASEVRVNGSAHRDIVIFVPARGAGSLYRIAC